MKPIYFWGGCEMCGCALDNPCTLRILYSDGESRRGVIKAISFLGVIEWDFLFEIHCLSCGASEIVHYERQTPSERLGTVSVGAVMVGLGILQPVRELDRLLASSVTFPLLAAVAAS